MPKVWVGQTDFGRHPSIALLSCSSYASLPRHCLGWSDAIVPLPHLDWLAASCALPPIVREAEGSVGFCRAWCHSGHERSFSFVTMLTGTPHSRKQVDITLNAAWNVYRHHPIFPRKRWLADPVAQHQLGRLIARRAGAALTGPPSATGGRGPERAVQAVPGCACPSPCHRKPKAPCTRLCGAHNT